MGLLVSMTACCCLLAQEGLTQFRLLDETAQETQLAIEESMNRNTIAVIACASRTLIIPWVPIYV
jgi:hypothetical protein